MLGRFFRITVQVLLLLLGGIEFIFSVIQLPTILNQTHFFDIHSMLGLGVFLLAAGFLPVGITKALMQRPTGWAFLILGHIFWFSWVAVEIDVLQEILQTVI